jgi:hypothetical protein
MCIPLRDAISHLTPQDKWDAILKVAGHRASDALELLSGRLVGRVSLDASIISRGYNPRKELARFRDFEKLRDSIIDNFDRERQAGMLLRGHTTVSPAKAVKISAELSLEYDFAAGSAQSGDLKFYGITACEKEPKTGSSGSRSRRNTVSEAALRDFAASYIASNFPPPSFEMLAHAAKDVFPEKHISRKRLRALHQELIPDHLRIPGPKKRNPRTRKNRQ